MLISWLLSWPAIMLAARRHDGNNNDDDTPADATQPKRTH
jgi:hypothetical protein